MLGAGRPHDTSARLSALDGAESVSGQYEAGANQSKAPGNNRPNPEIKYRGAVGGGASAFVDFDYEQMKLLANRAIHTKPGGESRVPTDLWAGCGFSKSTPEADLRLRLNHTISRRPVVPTTYESREPEIDSELWKDPLEGAILDSDGAGRHDDMSDIVAQMSAMSGHSDLINRSHHTSHYDKLLEQPHQRSTSSFDECLAGAVGGAGANFLGAMMADGDGGVLADEAVGGAEGGLWSPGRDALAASGAAGWQDDTEDLAELFSKLGLGKYTDIFQQQEIDLVTFLTLTEQDLKELGISTFGARRKMLNAITDMNKRQTLLQAVPRLPSSFHDIGGRTSHRHNVASQSGRW